MTTTDPHQAATGTADPTPPPRESPLSVGSQGDVLEERPELLVAGAFVGGLVLAQVLRKLGPS
jgi:hypothetical protein